MAVDGWIPDKPATASTDGWIPDTAPGKRDTSDMLSSHERGKRVLPPKPVTERVGEWWKSNRKKIAKTARPVIEGVGMGVGSVVGATAGGATGGITLPVVGAIPGAAAGGVAGSALGYAAGSQIADIIEGPSATKVQLPVNLNELSEPKYRERTVGEEVGTQANKLMTGAEMEMGGQSATALGGSVVNKLVGGRVKGIPLSDKRTAYKAANQYAKSQESSEVAAANNKLRATETENVLKRVGTTHQPSVAQKSGSYQAGALEQSLTSADKEFAEQMSYNDALLRGDATSNLKRAVGRGDELPRVQPRDITGSNIAKAIETSESTVKGTEQALWAKIPDYPMPLSNFTQANKTIAGDATLPGRTKSAVRNVLKHSENVPHTAEAMQGIEQTINDEISIAVSKGDKGTARVLKQMKTALGKDADAISEAALKGDIMVSDGKVIVPSKIKADIAQVEADIAAEQARVTPVSATERANHLNKHLHEVKDTAGTAASNGWNDERWLTRLEERLADRQAKGLSLDYQPPVGQSEGNQKVIDNLTARRSSLQATLDAAKPAEDVAAAYSAAKKYSKEEKFDRFYRGSVLDVMKSGEQATGRQITNEQIPSRFSGRKSDAEQLSMALRPEKNAINPETGQVFTQTERVAAGKNAAAEQLMPHFTEQIISKTVDANTGVMNIPRAMAYVRQNGDVLHELGLTNSVRQVIKGQIPRSIEAELTAKGVDILGNPTMTALEARKMIRRMGPSVRRLYGENAMQALDDYGKMMEILGRNKNVSYSKGSTTAEKLTGSDMAMGMAEPALALTAVVGGHGWVFSAAKNLVKGLFEGALKNQQVAINNILKEALINPAAAEALMKIAKSKPANVTETAARVLKPFMRQIQIGPDGERGMSGVGANAKAGMELGANAALGTMNMMKGKPPVPDSDPAFKAGNDVDPEFGKR